MKLTYKPLFLRIAVLALFSMLTACGFQLRGGQEMAPELKSLALSAPISLHRSLYRSLNAMGVEVRPRGTSTASTYSLFVTALSSERRTASFDSNVSAAEYEISQRFQFDLRAPDGTLVMGPVEITAERVYVHNRDRLLGDDGEREVLGSEMQDEAAQRIITHLRTLTSEQIQERISAAADSES